MVGSRSAALCFCKLRKDITSLDISKTPCGTPAFRIARSYPKQLQWGRIMLHGIRERRGRIHYIYNILRGPLSPDQGNLIQCGL